MTVLQHPEDTLAIETDPFFTYDESDCYVSEDDTEWLADLKDTLGEEEFAELDRYDLERERENYAEMRQEDLDEDLDEILTEEMQSIQGENARYMEWDVNLRNFGWRHKSGGGTVKADIGRKLMQEVLPNTQCMFKLFRCTDSTGRKGIVVNNAHHDAPMGGEMYYIFEHVEEEDTDEESYP